MISESIKEYVERKAFENIIIKNLTKQIDKLYSTRKEMYDCIMELDATIDEAEKDLLKMIDKTKN